MEAVQMVDLCGASELPLQAPPPPWGRPCHEACVWVTDCGLWFAAIVYAPSSVAQCALHGLLILSPQPADSIRTVYCGPITLPGKDASDAALSSGIKEPCANKAGPISTCEDATLFLERYDALTPGVSPQVAAMQAPY